MSIIDKGSVFIVGAGCSAPFGVPVGGSLIDDLAAQLKREFTAATQNPENRHPGAIGPSIIAAHKNKSKFTTHPINLCVYKRAINGESFDGEAWQADLNKLIKLEHLLIGQTSETIDDFIAENPDYAKLTKIGIAWAIFNALYSYKPDDRSFARYDVSRRYLGEEETRNWIHLLINIIRQGLRDGEVNSENKVRIISFNYDRILETVLEEQFHNTQSSYGYYDEYIEIVHPHGVFDSFPKDSSDPAALICSWADKINVVNDAPISEAATSAHEQAERWVINATRVYAAGFAFAKPNCELLGLTKGIGAKRVSTHCGPTIQYCNYDGGAGLREIVKRRAVFNSSLQELMVDEQSGTKDERLSIEEWIRGGFLGEMPG